MSHACLHKLPNIDSNNKHEVVSIIDAKEREKLILNPAVTKKERKKITKISKESLSPKFGLLRVNNLNILQSRIAMCEQNFDQNKQFLLDFTRSKGE